MIEQHSIRVVARRTGLSAHVIRAWERRYHAIRPARSETNRRVYSKEDIERLRLLRAATRGGHRIGEIAHLSDEELGALVEELRVEPETSAAPTSPLRSEAKDLFGQALAAVEQLDAEGLEAIFARAAARSSRSAILDQLILPLMERIGDAWREGSLRVAHEHLASAIVRTFLGNLERSYPSEDDAPRLLVATPVGQVHELGALAVAAAAAAEGWHVIYLGASLPADEILAACELRRCAAVSLSITYPPDDARLDADLRQLGRSLPPGVPLLVGGRSAAGYRTGLEEAGAVVLENLDALRLHLEDLRLDATQGAHS